MAFVTSSDGRRLEYDRNGSGPLLVMHPGGPGMTSRFLGDRAGLDERLELVVLHPRGTDGSDRPRDARAYAVSDFVADLDELRAHLGVEGMNLAGYSHGGVVAMAYAARFPDRVTRLLLVATAAHFGADEEAAMEAAMACRAGEPWYEDARAAFEAEAAGAFSTDDELMALALREFPMYFASYGDAEVEFLARFAGDRANADALRRFNEELAEGLDLRSELAAIDASTLIVAGEEDFICGPVPARRLHDTVRGSRLVLLPGAGHFLLHEARDRLREEVFRFLEV